MTDPGKATKPTKRQAGETTLQGLGITLISGGFALIQDDPEIGGAMVITGLLCVYGGIHYRDISLGLSADGVRGGLESIRDSARSVTQRER